MNQIKEMKLNFSSPWTGGLASVGGTPDPGTTDFWARKGLKGPLYPKIGGSGDVFPPLRERGSMGQSYADMDFPLTGSHG